MSTSTCAEACKELFLQFTVDEKKTIINRLKGVKC